MIGVNAATQRRAWLWYAALPLCTGIVLGVGTALAADRTFLGILDVGGVLPWHSVLYGGITGLAFGSAYVLIATRAASDEVQVSDLRGD